MSKVVGPDGCKGGWIAAVALDGRLIAVKYYESARAAIEAHEDAEVFAFDIPIGLSESGKRAADEAARNFLKERSSVVFDAPIRALLPFAYGNDSYEQRRKQANAESWRIANRGFSAHSFGLLAKIAEVDPFASDHRVYEAHPEVSFVELVGGQPMQSKRTWNGLVRRRELLRAAGLVIPDQLGVAGDRGAPDDIMDAVACAWTAGRIANGEARTFPDPPERIGGRDVAIWC